MKFEQPSVNDQEYKIISMTNMEFCDLFEERYLIITDILVK